MALLDKSKDDDMSYPTSMDGYEILGRIGKGAFASVFIAKCPSLDKHVAIKVIELELNPLQTTDEEGRTGGGRSHTGAKSGGHDNDNDNDKEKEKENDKDEDISLHEIQKETAIMTRMNHRNIVCCYASFSVLTELWLVMPLLIGSCSDIIKSIKDFNNGFMDELIICTIIKDVLNGIQYIHNDGRVHRDIKSANILLSENGVCQISDFGVSGAIIEGGLRKNGRHTFTGSLWFMSPEVLQRDSKHSYSTDIWSIGITALELAFGKPPHFMQRPVKVMLTILQQPPPTMSLCIQQQNNPNVKYKYSKKFKDFLSKCLQKDPTKRASASNLLNHSFIKQAKDSEYLLHRIIAKYNLSVSNQFASSANNVNSSILPNSLSQKLNKNEQNTNIESNGFDFNSDIHSMSHSGIHSPDLHLHSEHDLRAQTQAQTKEKLGRFDVTIHQQPLTLNSKDSATKKGRFRITKYGDAQTH